MSISISSMTAAPVRLTSFLPADSEDLPWSRQLKVLSSEVDDEQKQEVLSNMNTQRLCFTCLVSQKHFRCVSHFLELLRTSGQREKPSARLVPSIGSSEWRETLFVPATIDIGCLSSSSFDGDVNGVPEGPGLWLRVRDESLASHYPRYDSHVDGSLLELTATKLLARFRLRFDDVRLLLTASQCAIVGSSVLHVAHPNLSVVPGNLDVVTACGQGPAIADFFILAASYAVIAGPEQDENVRGAGPRWTLALGSSLRINIIESLTNNPLDVVVAFNFSCVISAWQADGIWLAYPEMTRNGIVVATPASFPMREGLSGRVDVWSVFRKYADLGFEVGRGRVSSLSRMRTRQKLSSHRSLVRRRRLSLLRVPRVEVYSRRRTAEAYLLVDERQGLHGRDIVGSIRRSIGEVNWEPDDQWMKAAHEYLASEVGPMPFNDLPDYM
ncbi:hypothetical protein R3P38DRAFT_3225368 [Favolaschia claudopus]|uniref:Uncharacterized protein n=1 Tax=Favolaschia claudopus TaxID=2862362 RepID=A0AAV9ZW13_9AGAR